MVNSKWILKDAIQEIQKVQQIAMDSGFYICLAGSVLNLGFSENDLDLVAMNRTRESNGDTLRKQLELVWGDRVDECLLNNRLHLLWRAKNIEITIVEHEHRSRY